MKKFEFHPFDKVLVRSDNNAKWVPQWYSHKDGKDYVTMDGSWNLQCIPYEGNEDLYDTSDPYVEPFLPENGDFVTMVGEFNGEKATWTCICKDFKDNKIYYHAGLDACHRLLRKEKTHYDFNPKRERDGEIRLATEEEKNLLLSKLHENGKDWNAEKKEIVDWEWEPSEGECFYYPIFRNGEFVSISGVWENEDKDSLSLLSKGYVFRTDEECTYLCNRLNKSIKNVK